MPAGANGWVSEQIQTPQGEFAVVVSDRDGVPFEKRVAGGLCAMLAAEQPAFLPEETLAEELSEGEYGVLLIARGHDVPKVTADCRRLGVEARVLGGHKSWTFLSPGGEFHRVSEAANR